MNQSKLEVVKQEMARVNVDILGISELKWTGMGEFNSEDYCGQESLRKNGVAVIVNKRVQKASSPLMNLFFFLQWHPTPVLLPGKSHGRRSLVACSPWGC